MAYGTGNGSGPMFIVGLRYSRHIYRDIELQVMLRVRICLSYGTFW